jgi:hypothetical protein
MTTRVALAMAALIVTALTWVTPKAEINALAVAQHEGGATLQAQPGMQSMMKMHEQMMVEMKANRARLDTLVRQREGRSHRRGCHRTRSSAEHDARPHGPDARTDDVGPRHDGWPQHDGTLTRSSRFPPAACSRRNLETRSDGALRRGHGSKQCLVRQRSKVKCCHDSI